MEVKAILIKLGLILVAKLPFSLAQRIGMGIGFMLFIFPNSVKKIVQINIKKCFADLSPQQQRKLLCNTLMHIGSNALEHPAWWIWPHEKFAPLIKTVQGEEHIRAAQQAGKNILILVPHLGAWEVLQRYMPRHYKCASMYRPLRIAAMEQFIKKARSKDGADILPLTRSGLREAYARLGRGEVMGVLPDQVPHRNGGVFAPFFGIPAWTTTFALKMAQKTQATVFMGYAKRLGCGKGFSIHFSLVNPDILNQDLAVAATAMNADIEACVREIPEQYQWGYKRFKIQPEGAPKFY